MVQGAAHVERGRACHVVLSLEPDLIASILRTLCADILADHGTGASSGLGEGHLGWDDVNGVIRTVF